MPTVNNPIASITANFTSPAIALNVTTEFIKFHANISAAGWGGLVSPSNSSLSFTLAAPNISWADTNTTFFPFVQYVTEATGGLVEASTTPFNSFYEFYQTFFVDPFDGSATNVVPDAPRVEFASRFLPLSLAEMDPAQAAKIILLLSDVSME